MSMLKKLKSLLQEVNEKTSGEIFEDMKKIHQEKLASDEKEYMVRSRTLLANNLRKQEDE